MHGKKPKKSINDGFMYVCVAEKCKMMDFFGFFFYSSFYRQFSAVAGKKTGKMMDFLCMYVCVKQNPSLMDFFCFFFMHLSQGSHHSNFGEKSY